MFKVEVQRENRTKGMRGKGEKEANVTMAMVTERLKIGDLN